MIVSVEECQRHRVAKPIGVCGQEVKRPPLNPYRLGYDDRTRVKLAVYEALWN